MKTTKNMLALLPAVLALGAPALAQSHMNPIQRHPGATGVVAGVATHHALKVSAANAKAHHQKLNFAQRHPTMAGVGAAMATHHVIKSHTPH